MFREVGEWRVGNSLCFGTSFFGRGRCMIEVGRRESLERSECGWLCFRRFFVFLLNVKFGRCFFLGL